MKPLMTKMLALASAAAATLCACGEAPLDPGPAPSAKSTTTTPALPSLGSPRPSGSGRVPGHPEEHPGAGPDSDAEMLEVRAGGFGMGCDLTRDNTCRGDELPFHPITLDEFSIDRLEVTQGAYSKCVAAGSCRPPTQNYDPAAHAAYPVRDVSWELAHAYCQWAGKRLPTEAEWEKAARGTRGQKYPWGDQAADCTRANYHVCMKGVIPSGMLSDGASPYGALDMGGNVWEWVSDWYQANYYLSSPGANPAGPASGTMHVARGGGFQNDDWPLRASARVVGVPNTAYDQIGFRCAR